jgi:hypothetical protein
MIIWVIWWLFGVIIWLIIWWLFWLFVFLIWSLFDDYLNYYSMIICDYMMIIWLKLFVIICDYLRNDYLWLFDDYLILIIRDYLIQIICDYLMIICHFVAPEPVGRLRLGGWETLLQGHLLLAAVLGRDHFLVILGLPILWATDYQRALER